MSTTEPMPHLTRAARDQLTLSDADRITAIYGARFVPHPNAKRVLERLNFLVGYPKCSRMQCLLLYGDSGMGKTMVVEKFLREHPPTFDTASGVARIPVVSVQMPPAPDEKRVYTQLMSAIGAPSMANERLHVLEERALRLLRKLEPKVIVIDEVHHLLSGSAREQRRSLNLLKFIANDLRVCMVAIGTADARIAIQTDLQVASRFEPCHLPRWSSTDEVRGFLAAFLKGLPLHEPSDITSREAVHLLLMRTGGITGRIALILARAAEMAIRKGTETVNAQWLELASRDLDLSPPLRA